MTDASDAGFPLSLDRVLAAPRRAVWRCWTEPGLITRWFTPAPWTTAEAEVDLRVGGIYRVVMAGPNGERSDNPGSILAVEPERRLVTTDAFTADFVPRGSPFTVLDLRLDDADGGTRYRPVVRHWSEEGRTRHAEMGFTDGWNRAADQLEAVASALDVEDGR